MKRRTWLIGMVVAACAGPAGVALADPIPGATYNGQAADGGSLSFTVSSDGTIVDSYSILGVHGAEPNGGQCLFQAAGSAGVWPGAPIVNNVFSYTVGNNSFQGTFPGTQTASGTFRLYNPGTADSPTCDTGTVQWTASTTSTPPNGSGNGGGGGGNGGNGSHGSTKPLFASRVVFHKLPKARLGGRISTTTKLCRANRTVVLWRGAHRIGSTRTKASGTYWFARRSALRGFQVRASVKATNLASAVCAAGTSKFIKA